MSRLSAYVVNPLSKLGSTKNVNSKPGQVNAGLFWSSSKSVASTRISKTMSTLDTWLLQSSYSKKSFDVGLSGGVKGVDLGGKFGFDSEKSQKSSVSTGKKEERLTAIHVIPIIDINLNETTLQLSPDCVKDIVRLRQDRRFADLKKFYEDYGTITSILNHSMLMSSQKVQPFFKTLHWVVGSTQITYSRRLRRKRKNSGLRISRHRPRPAWASLPKSRVP